MTAQHCGQTGCTCPDPLPEIRSTDELAQLPQLSVVQFRGPGLGAKNRLVWQLDEEWFSAGRPLVHALPAGPARGLPRSPALGAARPSDRIHHPGPVLHPEAGIANMLIGRFCAAVGVALGLAL